MKVVGYEKGGITPDIKDKPGIRYDISSNKDASLKKKDGEAAPAPAAGGEAAPVKNCPQ